MCPKRAPSLAQPPTRRRLSGLTLIELMLSIGLVSILVAVAIPSYQSHRERVLVRTAVQDLVVMSTAIRMYELDAGRFPPSLAAVSLGGKLDPWGREYVYYNVAEEGRGGARKDRALNPINTDFDLYSVGRDGETKKQVSQRDSLDDVLRGRNGSFTGVAADF